MQICAIFSMPVALKSHYLNISNMHDCNERLFYNALGPWYVYNIVHLCNLHIIILSTKARLLFCGFILWWPHFLSFPRLTSLLSINKWMLSIRPHWIPMIILACFLEIIRKWLITSLLPHAYSKAIYTIFTLHEFLLSWQFNFIFINANACMPAFRYMN